MEKINEDFDKLNDDLDVIQPLFDNSFDPIWRTYTMLNVIHYRQSPEFRDITLTLQKLIIEFCHCRATNTNHSYGRKVNVKIGSIYKKKVYKMNL